jgi:TolB-like protein
MDLLVFLAEHQGEVLSGDRILRNVWPHTYVSDGALQTAVSALRKAVDDDARRPTMIETIRKRGYRLLVESTASRPLVAVLPFQDLSQDEETYLTDGLTDTLISALGRNTAIRVISRHSVMAFRDSRLPLAEIAEHLGVSYVVEGAVRRDASEIGVAVKVIDAAVDEYVWTRDESVSLDGIFELQQRLAGEITTCMVGPSGGFDAEPIPEVTPDAVEDYLRGRFHWNKFAPDHFPRALACFESAVSRSPDFAAAHAGIADVWGALGYWGMLPASDVRAPLRASLARAGAFRTTSAEWNVLAGAASFHFDHDWPGALGFLEQAIDLNPSLAHARVLMSLILGTLGDDRALEEADRGRRLDPLAPPVLLARALCLSRVGRYADVATEIGRMREIEPEFPPAIELDADLAWVVGAADAMEKEQRVWRHHDELAALLRGHGEVGARMSRAARRLAAVSRETYVSPRVVARLLSLAGHVDEAIDVLHQALDDEDLMQIDFLQMNPAFQAVRRHRRYPELAGRIGLPAATPV